MHFVKLPSGLLFNLGCVIEAREAPEHASGYGARRAVVLITATDGGGRVHYDEDADMLLALMEADAARNSPEAA